MGLSFIGAIATDREARTGDAHNRVVGPDFQWRPSGTDSVTGQWLYSESKTPDRPDLADEWTGQTLTGHAANLQWSHQHDALRRVRDVTRTSATASAPTAGSCHRSAVAS